MGSAYSSIGYGRDRIDVGVGKFRSGLFRTFYEGLHRPQTVSRPLRDEECGDGYKY